ncbi:MAG: hypothetical protein QM715_02520 [Nibricoccus sp.]
MNMLRSFMLLLCVALWGGCITVKLQPVEAHITVDVNVKVDKALNDFFGDLDQKSASLSATSAKP